MTISDEVREARERIAYKHELRRKGIPHDIKESTSSLKSKVPDVKEAYKNELRRRGHYVSGLESQEELRHTIRESNRFRPARPVKDESGTVVMTRQQFKEDGYTTTDGRKMTLTNEHGTSLVPVKIVDEKEYDNLDWDKENARYDIEHGNLQGAEWAKEREEFDLKNGRKGGDKRMSGKCGPGEELIEGYTRRDGTRVAPYCRTSHDNLTPGDRRQDRENGEDATGSTWKNKRR